MPWKLQTETPLIAATPPSPSGPVAESADSAPRSAPGPGLSDKEPVMPIGTITKLVRVAAPDAGGQPAASEGYGIIRGENGQDVYFVNSSVNGCRFDELVSGQAVEYTVEEGPLGRAAVVCPLQKA